MIYLVNGADVACYANWIDQMHRLRARVFSDRLGWQVNVVDGLERDFFDDCNPLYLLSVDAVGVVQGTLRLLPTTGPNMLRDTFPMLTGEHGIVENPTIWESSRFAIDLHRSAGGAAPSRRVSPVTTELLCGLVEVGMRVGLTFVLSVFDARMDRVLRAAGYPADHIGEPQRIGGVMTYAGLFEVSEESWQSIARVGGIAGPVISPDSDMPKAA